MSRSRVKSEKEKEQNRRYMQNYVHPRGNYVFHRERKLLAHYGITISAWDKIFEKQGWRCAICKTSTPPHKHGWHTDHDHLTGTVRGILCAKCNRGLGQFEDNIITMKAAIAYIEGSL